MRLSQAAWASALSVLLSGHVANAGPPQRHLDPTTADAEARALRESAAYTFCSKPDEPLSVRERDLCPLAGHVPGCAALVTLCDKPPDEPIKIGPFWERVAALLARAAPFLVALLIAGLVALVVYLVVRALRADRDEVVSEAPISAGDVTLLAETPPEGTATSAEALLARAARARAQGDLLLSLSLYLAAALRALDDRGSIRIARDRTNGEYVRACQDAALRPTLKELVRDVDAVQFGGASLTDDALGQAAGRATRIVRARMGVTEGALAAPLVLLVVLLLACGCKGPSAFGSHGDPAGHDLLIDLLGKQGAEVSKLPGSLANLPMAGRDGPVVIVDLERVPLEEETRTHLALWAKQGGRLVLAGPPSRWPKELWGKSTPRSTPPGEEHPDTTVTIEIRDASPKAKAPAARDDDDHDDDDAHDDQAPRAHPPSKPSQVHHATLADGTALTWPSDDHSPRVIARFADGELYGALRDYGDGKVLGLANADLLTNVGISVPGNAAALVAMLAALDRNDFAVARAEQGISPPSNPLAGLLRVGLGPLLLHVLVFLPVLFLAYGVRQAAPEASAKDHRRAFAEHIEAVGALYAERRAARHALAVYGRYVDDRVRAVMGRGGDPAQFLAARGGADPDFTARLCARAAAAEGEGPPAGSELADLQRLSTIYARAIRRD